MKARRQSSLAAVHQGVRFCHVNPLQPIADGPPQDPLQWTPASSDGPATCQNALLHRTPDKALLIDSNDRMANRAARAPEMSPYEPVKAFLEQLGFPMKGQVFGGDIVGVRSGEPPMVVINELKMPLTLELLLQGVGRLRAADEVWLAVLATRRGRDRDRRAHRLCRLLGFGPLAVHPADGTVEILAEPTPSRPRPNLPQRRRLLKEHATRRGVTTRGGSSRQPTMTAYRQQAIVCATSQEAGPMRRPELTVAPGAGPILDAMSIAGSSTCSPASASSATQGPRRRGTGGAVRTRARPGPGWQRTAIDLSDREAPIPLRSGGSAACCRRGRQTLKPSH